MGRCPGGASKASWAGGQSCAQVMSSLSSIITAKETGGSPKPGTPLSGHCFLCHSTRCLKSPMQGLPCRQCPRRTNQENGHRYMPPLGCTPCCKTAATLHGMLRDTKAGHAEEAGREARGRIRPC